MSEAQNTISIFHSKSSVSYEINWYVVESERERIDIDSHTIPKIDVFGWMLIPRQLRNCRERKMHKRENTMKKKNEFTETGSAVYVRWACVSMFLFEFVRVWLLVSARTNVHTENHITAHWSLGVYVSVLSTVITGYVYFAATVKWNGYGGKGVRRRDEATTRTCLQNDSRRCNKNLFMWVSF